MLSSLTPSLASQLPQGFLPSIISTYTIFMADFLRFLIKLIGVALNP